jgi:hypothetical protein
VLEDHADTAACLAQLLAGAGAAADEGGEVLSGDRHGAGGGTLQEVDAADEGGLAGAGLADDAVHLALADVQIDAVEGGDLSTARAVDLGEALGGDHVGFRHCRLRGAGERLRRAFMVGIGLDAARFSLWRWNRGETVRGAARSRTAQARTGRGVSLRGARNRRCGGPQKAHIRHIQRAPGVIVASVARVRLLVVVMRKVKQKCARIPEPLSE